MLHTANMRGRAKRAQPAGYDYQSTTIPAPIGGWDASSPLAAMPPQNAVELINWFPQPGYIELRRGFVNYADTGTGEPVETVMGYQGFEAADNALFAVSDGDVYDVTGGSSSITTITGLTSSRVQKTMFNNGAVAVLWCCNGFDAPFYYNGTAWVTTSITGVTGADIVNVVSYRNRLWGVLKDSTKACYLGLNSIDGVASTFDVGAQFPRGGFLQAIATWNTSNTNGPQEYIGFISSYGDIAVYLILDPSSVGSIFYLGTSQVGSPIGRRCTAKLGSDVAMISIDGLVTLSMTLNYDRAIIQAKALTANIRTAMTEAAQRQSNYFGWQVVSYPRNTMTIMNVPIGENVQQEQFVMNTVTGAWCRFQGQNAAAWEVYEDRAFFGNNDGLVCLADESSGDEDQTLSASAKGAFNPYGALGNIKQWEMILPLVSINTAFPTDPELGLNIDFGNDTVLDPIDFVDSSLTAIWNDPDTKWDEALWPGEVVASQWATVNGVGRFASIVLAVDVPWSAQLVSPLGLKINSFTILYQIGAVI